MEIEKAIVNAAQAAEKTIEHTLDVQVGQDDMMAGELKHTMEQGSRWESNTSKIYEKNYEY